jgi:LuxR family maltose regulon positive regulatory protein
LVREGIVPRAGLLEQLVRSSDTPVVLLVASAGYGKSTLLTQWADADERSFAWLSVTPQLRDPAVLLAEVADALHLIEPIDSRTRARLTTPGADYTSVRLPRLARMVESRTVPFVLVIDDAQVLASGPSLAALQVLCDSVPTGSQIALASREEPNINVGALRARRDLLTLDAASLAMSDDEGIALLRESGLEVGKDDASLLVERTEGWPVALYLAALALREEADPAEAAHAFAGDDRFVVDYLRDELFAALSDETAEFLVRTSVLDRLSGPLCDFVLESSGSASILQALEDSNLLLIPLDRTREWYRYHQLFGETLRARLRLLEPEREVILHGRASLWCEERGDFDRAVAHAAQAGDVERFDALVWRAGPVLLGSGHTITVQRWLEGVTPEETAERPSLVVVSAWLCLTNGDVRGFDHWAQIASHVTPDVALPDGSALEGWLAMLRAVNGRQGVKGIREDAARAYELDHSGSPFRPILRTIQGAALRLSGERTAARECCEEGVAVGRLLNPVAGALALAQLALVDIDEGAWSAAREHVDDSLALLDEFGLEERPPQALTYAGAALVAAHEGATQDARRDAKHALWLVSMMGAVAPWVSIEARLLVARAQLLLGDVSLARVLCREAQELVVAMPDSGDLPERIGQVQRMIDSEAVPIGVTATPMTPAEMRVLRYLPTHLTFAAIADELFVSRNTVKTQAISIYRKLAVSSRGPAVAAARDLGLLDD